MGLLVAFLTVLALTGALTASVLWRLRRRNRVVPGVRTRAPLGWLASPRRAAVAHRRLRRAVLAARAAAGPTVIRGRRFAGGTGPAGEDLALCVAELERHAAAVDDHLVVAARCSPTVRRSLLQGLAGEVAQIEGLAARVAASALSSPARDLSGAGRETSQRITERLDAIDAARAELAALEATWASPTYDPGPVPPPRLGG